MTSRDRALSRLSIATIAIALVALLAAFIPGRNAASSVVGKPSVRVGLVFDVGGRGDKSFNDAAYAGVDRAQRELGAAFEMIEPSGAEDREAALRLFASRGFDLVIGVGFIFSRDVDAVARDYPKIRFACVDYSPGFGPNGPMPIPDNVTGLAFREQEGAFLVGAVAGLQSKSHELGFVGGMDIPLIHKFEAGYRAGVKAVCDRCNVHVAYAGTTPDAFRDPAKGKAIAIAQIGSGADVLFHASGSTGHGVFVAASEAHVWAIGVDSDQYDEAPNAVLTSMIKRADVAVFDAVRAAARGELRGGMRVLGLAEEGLDYVHDGAHGASITPEIKAKIASLRGEIIAGRIVVPSE